jgi:uncharacterized protein (DUF4415 family)
MISDEPDEDADTLDDEKLLQACFGTEASEQRPGLDGRSDMEDWPPPRERDRVLEIDAVTLAWFKANDADWRFRISSILRAWVAAQTSSQRDPMQQVATGE